MSISTITMKSFTVALALSAIAAPTAGAQAPVPPPPSLPPSSAETVSIAPASDTPAAPASETPAAPAHSESPAPTSSSAPAGTQQSAPVSPPAVRVSKAPVAAKHKAVKRRRKTVRCATKRKHRRTRCVKRHTTRHRRHVVKGRAAAVTPWFGDADATCEYNTARQDVVETIAPGMALPTGAGNGYFASQPVYYYYDFTTRQWAYGGSGQWMWAYRDGFGTRQWQFFDTAMHSDMLGTQVMNVTRGYYWKVAVRHYWYPTATSAAMSAPLVWAPAMITNFVPQDVFAASLYQATSGNYCFAQ